MDIRTDIEELAAIERGSASAGERRSAEWAAERLREVGAEDVGLAEFRYSTTFAHAQALHLGAGLFAALRGWPLLTVAAFASFELDYSGRSQWTRRFLPRGTGWNLTARLPSHGQRRRTVVLVAHHDAAHTGRMWDPRLTAAGDRAAAKSGKRAPLALLPELALLASALRPFRHPAAALLALSLGFLFDQARSASVPGANDNASGVAAVLELTRRLAVERRDGVEVLVLVCGCEESGMGGMAAWLAEHGEELDRETTLVLGLDTVGSGEPIVLTGEGGLWPVRYDEEEVAIARTAAAADGVTLKPWRIGGWTDPALARLAGLRTMSLLSVKDGGFPNYHLPSDRPAEVDLDCVRDCVKAALGIVRAFSG